jgi:hypothetical protein
MSTGLECLLVEAKPQQWYYILQNPRCPVQCWDWMEEDPDVRGPYASEEACWQGLRKHHANPGGYSSHELTPGQPLSKKLQALIDKARRA